MDYNQLKNEITGIESAVRQLKPNATADLGRAKDQLDKLAACRKDIGGLAPGAGNANPTSDEVSDLKARYAIVERQLEVLICPPPPLQDNRKLLYSEHGQWARHFSTVRMTVMTFTITTCSAIIAWKWTGKPPDVQSLVYPVAILWAVGVITFWFFTYHTYKKVRSQKRLRDLIPDGIARANAKDAGDVEVDWACFVVPVFTLGISILACQQKLITQRWENVVAWAFAGLSVAAPFLIANMLKKTGRRICGIIVGVLLSALAIYLGGYTFLGLAKATSSGPQPPQRPAEAVTPQAETGKPTTNSESVPSTPTTP